MAYQGLIQWGRSHPPLRFQTKLATSQLQAFWVPEATEATSKGLNLKIVWVRIPLEHPRSSAICMIHYFSSVTQTHGWTLPIHNVVINYFSSTLAKLFSTIAMHLQVLFSLALHTNSQSQIGHMFSEVYDLNVNKHNIIIY